MPCPNPHLTDREPCGWQRVRCQEGRFDASPCDLSGAYERPQSPQADNQTKAPWAAQSRGTLTLETSLQSVYPSPASAEEEQTTPESAETELSSSWTYSVLAGWRPAQSYAGHQAVRSPHLPRGPLPLVSGTRPPRGGASRGGTLWGPVVPPPERESAHGPPSLTVRCVCRPRWTACDAAEREPSERR